jgi:hypothetical protein
MILLIASINTLEGGINLPPEYCTLDLDVDSDNDNNYLSPEENKEEEDIEMNIPGKLIMKNKDDDDNDGNMDSKDTIINGDDDFKDLAILVLKHYPLNNQTQVTLSVDDKSIIRVLEVDGNTLRIGPEVEGNYTLSLNGKKKFLVEGLKAGRVILTLTCVDGKKDDVFVTVADVKCKLLWETENKANQIFNPTPKDDPPGISTNKLYVVESPADDKYHVTLEVNDQPFYVRSKLMYAVFSEFGDKIANGYFPPNGPANITFDHPDFDLYRQLTLDFDIKVGCDFNGDGSLDKEEGFPIEVSSVAGELIGPAKVRGASTLRYNWASDQLAIEIIGSSLWTHAKALLRLFRDGSIIELPTDKQPSKIEASILNCFRGDYSEWLTHNCGAPFSSAGASVIPNYVWWKDTSFAVAVGDSANLRAAAKITFDRVVMPSVISYFDANPGEHEATFPDSDSIDVSWVSESLGWPYMTTTFVDLLGDMNFAIGRGRIRDHKARYTVVKGSSLGVDTYTVTALFHTGVVEDLYDWNRESTAPCEPPAIIQIGHGNGSYGVARDQGVIYRDRIEFETTLANPYN